MAEYCLIESNNIVFLHQTNPSMPKACMIKKSHKYLFKTEKIVLSLHYRNPHYSNADYDNTKTKIN